ncbi:MAG: hypothetical protein ACRD6U_04330 [Nitrososphaeraceae archaeon]
MITIDYIILEIFAQSSDYNTENIVKIRMNPLPQHLAINEKTNTIYAVSYYPSYFSVIDGKTNKVTANISLKNYYDGGIAINQETNKIYITEFKDEKSLTVIDGENNKVTANITFEDNIEDIAINEKTNTIYIIYPHSDSILAIDGENNKVTANITLPNYAEYHDKILVNPETNSIYVTHFIGESLSVIDGKTNKVISKFSLQNIPLDSTINTKTNKLYLKFKDSSTIGIIDFEKNELNYIINENYMDFINEYYNGIDIIKLNPKTNTIFVLNIKLGTLSLIDGTTNKITNSIFIGDTRDMAINSVTNKIYITEVKSQSLYVLDIEKVLRGFYSKEELILPNIDFVESENIVVNPKTNTIYAKINYPTLLLELDGKTIEIIKNVTLDEFITGRITINPTTNTIYAIGNSNSIFAINAKTNEIISYIPIYNESDDRIISDVTINPTTNTIYAIGDSSEIIHIINAKTNEIIKNVTITGVYDRSTISDIAVNPKTNIIYIAQYRTLLVMDGTTNEIIGHFTIDNGIDTIAVNSETNTIYATNPSSETLSVIDGEINKLITVIPLDDEYQDIAVNPTTNTIYLVGYKLNEHRYGMILIDGHLNKVLFPKDTIFHINPFNAGNIKCDDNEIAINQNLSLPFASLCTAEANKGFEFVNWIKNLENNSTITIKKTKDPHPLLSIVLSFLDFLGIKLENTDAKFSVTEYGLYTANFKEIPPPLPPEYVATLLSIVATAFIGSWLTPTIIEWRKAKKYQSKLNEYQNEIKELYKDNKFDKSDIDNLDVSRDKVISGYTRGKITKEQYDVLLNNISTRYNEIFQNEISILKNANNNDEKINLLDEIQTDLNDAYLKKKIDKEHYDLLKEMLSELEKNNNNGENRK